MSLFLYRINDKESQKKLYDNQYIQTTTDVFYWVKVLPNNYNCLIIDDFYNKTKKLLLEDEAENKLENSQYCLMTQDSLDNHFTKVYL